MSYSELKTAIQYHNYLLRYQLLVLGPLCKNPTRYIGQCTVQIYSSLCIGLSQVLHSCTKPVE